ncbi:phage tail protein [Pseudomonas gingeri]|uniref:phage tail protein n=1 Tax=Pseudomonas gingeri TaxID=117681 RepID=UPI00210A08AF|nr:tail fiber protein [Pseudomonas gingeri]
MDYPKSVPGVGLANGKFVDDNPITGAPGSLIPASWGNLVTDELLSIVQAGGLEPSEAAHDQLLIAIRTIIQSSLPPEKVRTTLAEYGITNAYTKDEVEALLKKASSLPVGSMVPFPKGTVPPGFLEADHSVQSIAAYPDLYAYLGTTFNDGTEAAGFFRLPESRGEFLRGWDHGRGVDAGRGLGSYQSGQIESHEHPARAAAGINGTGNTGVVAFSNTVVGVPQPTGVMGPYGGNETRPRNFSVMWCIKAWSAPINQGQIDISALAMLATQATEVNQGTGKVATQAAIVTGADDTTFITPKKLRFGFSASLTTNGYVIFPSWLGGLTLQWGYYSGSLDDLTALVPFPIAFPNSCLNISATADGSQSGASAFVGVGAVKVSTTQFRINGYGSSMATTGYHWWALGY